MNAPFPVLPAPRRKEDPARLARLEAAVAAMDEAILSLEPPSLLAGDDALAACARALNASPAASDVLNALSLDPVCTEALERLRGGGHPFSIALSTRAGQIAVQGGCAGAGLWLRLRLTQASPRADPSSGAADAAFEAHPAPAWVAGADGRPIRVNRAWLAAVGAASLDEALTRRLTFGRAADEAVADCARLAESRRSAVWLDLPEGRRAVEIFAAPLGEGRAGAFAMDVTDVRDLARAAERERRALEQAIAPLSDAVALFGSDQRLRVCNDAFARLIGEEPGGLAGQPRHGEILDRLRQRRMLPETPDYAAFKAAELARHASPEPSEGIWRLPDGRTFRLASQPHPAGGLILSLSEITAELRLKAQFNHQLQVQQATLDKLSDAVAVFGADTRLRLRNGAFERMFAIPGGALEREPEFDAVVDYSVARLHDLSFWRALKARIADPDPVARAPDGGEVRMSDGRLLTWQSRPLPDGATLLSFTDITLARDLEKAVEAQKAALETGDRLKREFVAAVSRELRTPLTTIVGYAELLSRNPSAERARDWLGAVTTAASRLARSIEDILDIAELDAGEAVLESGDVDLADLLAQATARARPAAASADAVVRIAEGSARGLMRADPVKLARVLDTLIDNALAQNPPAQTITLNASRADGEITLRVADDGRGIPFHIQPRIFERFGGPEAGATGLGLALVKGLIELHGGWVTVESEPGKGAAFSCHLPEAAAAPEERPELF